MIKNAAGTSTNKRLATNPRSLTCMETVPLSKSQINTPRISLFAIAHAGAVSCNPKYKQLTYSKETFQDLRKQTGLLGKFYAETLVIGSSWVSPAFVKAS
jgi:hypothetical protein